jgi:hypothetical protein
MCVRFDMDQTPLFLEARPASGSDITPRTPILLGLNPDTSGLRIGIGRQFMHPIWVALKTCLQALLPGGSGGPFSIIVNLFGRLEKFVRITPFLKTVRVERFIRRETHRVVVPGRSRSER